MPKLQDKLKKETIQSHFHDESWILTLPTYLYSNNNISILFEIQVILVVLSNIESNAIFINTDFHTRFAIGLYSFPTSHPNSSFFTNYELSKQYQSIRVAFAECECMLILPIYFNNVNNASFWSEVGTSLVLSSNIDKNPTYPYII